MNFDKLIKFFSFFLGFFLFYFFEIFFFFPQFFELLKLDFNGGINFNRGFTQEKREKEKEARGRKAPILGWGKVGSLKKKFVFLGVSLINGLSTILLLGR